MAYKIDFEVPVRELGTDEVVIYVNRDGEMMGRLKMSKGGIAWYRAKAKKPTRDLSWRELSELMEYGVVPEGADANGGTKPEAV